MPKRQATFWLLESPPLAAKDWRRFVDYEHWVIDANGLLERSEMWSSGEQLVVQVALSLFDGMCAVRLDELVETLDDEAWRYVITALGQARN